MVIKDPFRWDQKLYLPLRAYLWVLAFWTNDYSSLGLGVVRGYFPNTNFEPHPTIWTHGGPWKIVSEGPESMSRAGKKWQVLSGLLKRNGLKVERVKRCTPSEGVCGSKDTLTDSCKTPSSGPVNLGTGIIKRLSSFLAPNVGHIDSNSVDGRGKNLFCSEKIKKKRKKKNSSQISQAIWNHAREILDFSIPQLSVMMPWVVSPTCDDVCQGQSFLKMFQACRLLILFQITKMIVSQGELWLV